MQAPLSNSPLPLRQSRVRLGFAMALLLSVGVILGGWAWLVFYLVVLTIAFNELQQLFLHQGIRPSSLAFYPALVAFGVLAHAQKVVWLWPVMLAAIGMACFQWLFQAPKRTLSDLNATFFSLFYLGILPVHAILLRQEGFQAEMPWWQEPGLHYLTLVVGVIIAADVGAYYVGKSFGKHLLYPELSPKKTREGAFGGLIAGLAVGVPASLWAGLPFHDGFILSTLVIIAAALGDLVESKIKREIGVKDSGTLLAGHGGLLDRIDSYLFSVPLAYYYIHWVIFHQGIWVEIIDFLGRLLPLTTR